MQLFLKSFNSIIFYTIVVFDLICKKSNWLIDLDFEICLDNFQFEKKMLKKNVYHN